MKKVLVMLSLGTLLVSCGNPEKEKMTELLKEKIGTQLPFKDVKIAKIENGTGVIVDDNWCYWVDGDNKIFCVNGTSKSIYNVNNEECENAPINASFSDIEKIAK